MSLALQERLQTASTDYQKLQNDTSNAVEARQRLEAQLSENELVKKVRVNWYCSSTKPHPLLQEFAQLTESNTVYKLIGPILVKQEQAEAKSNVETRLEFIRGDMYVRLLTRPAVDAHPLFDHSKRVEAQLKDLDEKSYKKKLEVS